MLFFSIDLLFSITSWYILIYCLGTLDLRMIYKIDYENLHFQNKVQLGSSKLTMKKELKQ